jgi:thiol-disulfide isomerase/thioredoxin
MSHEGVHALVFLLILIVVLGVVVVLPIVLLPSPQQYMGVSGYAYEGFASKVASEATVTLYWAEWCPHCVSFKPIYESVSNKMGNKRNSVGTLIKFKQVDCVALPDKCKENHVTSYPTIKVKKGSMKETEYKGNKDDAAFTNFVDKL